MGSFSSSWLKWGLDCDIAIFWSRLEEIEWSELHIHAICWCQNQFNFITNFGKLIDPLADKSTQVAVLAALTFRGIIPLWMLIIVFVKELVMVAGASFLYGKKLVVSSRWYGKLTTVLFYVAIVCSLFIEYWNTSINPASPLPGFDDYIYYLAIIATVFSLVMYFKQFYQDGYLKKENLKIED